MSTAPDTGPDTGPDTDPTALHPVTLTVNGRARRLAVEARRSLADVLRRDLRMTGTHTGCEQGVCGSCTVRLDGRTVRSCLTLAVQADGADVATIEGVAPDPATLHPIQEAFWAQQGLQCGFCTPGMVLRAQELLEENPCPSRTEVREAISANLCRCTGYQFIVDAVLDAAERLAGAAPADGGPR